MILAEIHCQVCLNDFRKQKKQIHNFNNIYRFERILIIEQELERVE